MKKIDYFNGKAVDRYNRLFFLEKKKKRKKQTFLWRKSDTGNLSGSL